MSKQKVLFLVAIVGISTAYDFYCGYRQTRSIIDGIIYVFLGVIILAFLWWLFSTSQSSD